MSDLPSRLRASVKMGAVGGTSAEQSVCEKQMLEAASRIATLERENDTLRGLLGNSAKPCPYCGLAAEKGEQT